MPARGAGGQLEIWITGLTIGALIILWIAGAPLLRKHRQARIRAREFPAAWHALLEERLPVYRRLPPDLRCRLHGLIQIFLAEKVFVGREGLTITDEIRVTIAAQACLLLLNRETGVYPTLVTILVYPSTYAAEHHEVDEAGVRTEEIQARSGEAWEHGPLVLSWEDVRYGAEHFDDGGNVVIHEFAHQLDYEDSSGIGVSPFVDPEDQAAWAEVLHRAYEQLLDETDRGLPTLLDPYGATDPAEFLAVATETFFEMPQQLESRHGELYAALRDYYRLDPVRWAAAQQQPLRSGAASG